MDVYVIGIIVVVAFLGSGFTFFSGFGLGTFLTPFMLIFYPADLAIAFVGLMHLINNTFKFFLLGKKADYKVVLKFGLSVIIFAFIGSWLLIRIPDFEPLFQYQLFGSHYQVFPIKFILAILLVLFGILEFIPFLKNMKIKGNKLPMGGALSGFFGGFSGNQGALRTAFLIRTNLSKEAFISTGIVISLLIDITRFSVYSTELFKKDMSNHYPILVLGSFAVIFGSIVGLKLVDKISFKFLHVVVGISLIGLSFILATGII